MQDYLDAESLAASEANFASIADAHVEINEKLDNLAEQNAKVLALLEAQVGQELLFAVRPVRMVYSPRPPRRARALALRPSLWWAEPCALRTTHRRCPTRRPPTHPPLSRARRVTHAPHARVAVGLACLFCLVFPFGLSSASASARARRRPRRRPCRAAGHSRSTRWCST